MKRGLGLITAAVLLSIAAGTAVAAAATVDIVAATATADVVAGLPVHVQKLAPGVIRIWTGDHISSTATVAVATDGGLVIIDTLGFPAIDAELRKIIARELGRDDFKVLINTHEHGDHTGGNCVYSDCTIVGHELVAAGMAAQAEDRQRMIDWGTTRIAELQQQIAALPADSAATKAVLQEQLAITELSLAVRTSNAPACPPTKTFTDRLALNVGGTAFELSYIGGMHSASDIAVFVPKLGLLMTGDTMSDTWLTDTPGCLASFTARQGVQHDFPLLIKNWEALLAKKDAIKQFVTGHWNGELSFAGFAERVNYVKATWAAVNEAAAAGRDLASLQQEYTLAAKFPQLVQARGFHQRFHVWTVQEMWTAVTGQQDAAGRIYALIDEGAAESAVREVIDARGAKPARYYYQEPSLIAMGYRFLQEEKVPQSVAMFKAAVAIFPQAWNTYDSLAEALLRAGDTAGAVKNYERSIELNPDNQNGKDALARIRAGGTGT